VAGASQHCCSGRDTNISETVPNLRPRHCACGISFLFGLAPAPRATRNGAAEALKAGGRANTAGRERFGLRRGLVTVQVALSLVLMVGALLFSRSLGRLLSVDPGFRADGILITDLDLSELKLAIDRRQPFKRDLLEQVRAIPGVDDAAETENVPLNGSMNNSDIWMDGQDPSQKKTVNRIWVSPGYFHTMMAPDGGDDRNVFDIQQGAAIILAVKTPDKQEGHAAVHHAELWGLRGHKYGVLTDTDVTSTKWTQLNPVTPNYFFFPQGFPPVVVGSFTLGPPLAVRKSKEV